METSTEKGDSSATKGIKQKRIDMYEPKEQQQSRLFKAQEPELAIAWAKTH